MQNTSNTSYALNKGLIEAPKWLSESVIYETKTGSHSYGVNTPSSDLDLVGICIPPKEIIFPHLKGEILGFGKQKTRFRHLDNKEFLKDGEKHDLNVFSIVSYFRECMDCQPNWLEALYTPEECVTFETPISRKIRDNRDLFLSKVAFYRFTGFAKSQLNKMSKKDREPERLFKYGYHAVRMALEGEQIMKEGTLTLDANISLLNAVKQGEWSFEEIEDFCAEKEIELKDLYDNSDFLPYSADEDKIKTLMLECLEDYYGDLKGCIKYKNWG